MQIEFSKTDNPRPAPTVSLSCVYRVEADSGYRGVKGVSLTRPGSVAIRTTAGCGRLTLDGERVFELPEGSLFVAPARKLVRYAPKSDKWDFWWFEFGSDGSLMPEECVLPAAGTEEEGSLCLRALEGLREDTPTGRDEASAALTLLLCIWRGSLSDHPPSGTDSLAALAQTIRRNPEDNYTLPEMARSCSLSVRRFRDLFAQRTGMSPKDFITENRIERARELLLFTTLPITRVAEACGYNDRFYFSRVFTARCKITPVQFRKNAN